MSTAETKILTIDDDPCVLSSMARYLADFDYQVLTAENGAQGLDLFTRHQPDLILVDLRMPEIDGHAVLARVTEESPDTPIIVVSGTGEIPDVVEALRLGAWDYLLKPITDMSMLLLAIERALDRAQLLRERKEHHQNLATEITEKTKDLRIANMELSHEISLRELAQERLEASERRLKSMVDSLPDVIYRLDSAGNFTFVNEAVRSYGYSPQKLLGKSVLELIHPDDREAILSFAKNRGMPGSNSVRLRIVTNHGKTVHFEVRSTGADLDPVSSKGPMGICETTFEQGGTQGIARNISEKVALEKRLAQAQKMEALGTLASGIAHDFNNILSGIMGYTELASRTGAAGEETKAYLDEVRKAGNRAAELVKQILSYSRPSEEKRVSLRLQTVTNEAVELLRGSLGAEVTLRQHFDAGSGLVMAEPTQIHRVVMNLLTNACQSLGKEGGVVTIGITEVLMDSKAIRKASALGAPSGLAPGFYAKLTVSDTGQGMSEEIRERIFDPYFTTKGMGHGTGLGLATVHGIVRAHEGAITVESEAARGTSFSVYLPALHTAPVEESSMAGVPQGVGEQRTH